MSEVKSHIEVKRGSDRNFGMVFAVVFLLIALFPLLSGNPPYSIILAIALILFLLALFRPSILHKPNLLWFKFGMFIGAIIAPIVMMLIFFIAVVPVGIIMRLSGKDLLNQRIDKNTSSYWIERTDSDSSMKNQF